MKKSIEIWGVASDRRECAKIDNLVKNYQFTITTEDGTKYNAFALEPNMTCDIKDGLHIYAKGVIENGVFVAGYVERWGRYCDHCGKHHTEGYYSENTGMYFCSEECLKAEYTQEEIDEEIIDDDGNGYLYWTEWEN